MWENSHLPAVGSGKGKKMSLGKTTAAMLEEVEKAHIYIERLHERLGEEKARNDELETRLARVESLLGVDRAERIRQEGDRGLAHRLRGRPSNRAHQAQSQQRVLTLVREHYGDYGPTLASEVLARDHGLAVNRETLRQWMSRAGLWKSRRAKLKRVHVWRARRPQRGELVQWDTSTHD